MKKIINSIKNIKIKEFILNIPQYIFTHRITRLLIDLYLKLDIKSKLMAWGMAQYLYIFFFIPISILTIMSVYMFFEGQLFHLFGNTRCDINTFDIQDKYCNSYFSLMFGIVIVAMLQTYLYWHYLTTVKRRLF